MKVDPRGLRRESSSTTASTEAAYQVYHGRALHLFSDSHPARTFSAARVCVGIKHSDGHQPSLTLVAPASAIFVVYGFDQAAYHLYCISARAPSRPATNRELEKWSRHGTDVKHRSALGQ